MRIQEIGDSIWKIESEVVGKSVAILGGVHGNERTGIDVVKALQKEFSDGLRMLEQGTLYLVLGNLRAIEINERSSGNEQDLNRMFSAERLAQAPDGTYEDARAREIANKVLKNVEISIDIHSNNKPSVPFLACSGSEEHKKVYRWFTTDRNVTDPDFLLGGSAVTTDEYVDSLGGIGICYETGLAGDTSRANEVKEDCLNILRDLKMLNDAVELPIPTEKLLYKIVDRIMFTEAGFKYADGMGVESFQPVKAGEVIGFIGDVPYQAKQDGCLMFPKPEHLFWLGTPVTWIAEKL